MSAIEDAILFINEEHARKINELSYMVSMLTREAIHHNSVVLLIKCIQTISNLLILIGEKLKCKEN